MDVTSGLGYPRKTQGKPQNRIRRLAGPIDRSPRSHRANATGATCRNPREKRDSRWDRRSADILAISSSEQRFRYIPLQRIPGISGVNEAAPWPICYVAIPAWASRLAVLAAIVSPTTTTSEKSPADHQLNMQQRTRPLQWSKCLRLHGSNTSLTVA